MSQTPPLETGTLQLDYLYTQRPLLGKRMALGFERAAFEVYMFCA